MSELIITVGDLRRLGHCCAGQRRWFGAMSLDFHEFVRNGIPAQRLLDTGDRLAVEAVKRTKERRNG